MRRSPYAVCAAAAAVLVLGAATNAAVFPEAESNDTKATANVVTGMVAGDSLVGNSIATTGAGLDYFDITVGTAVPGIYRHRLVVTSPVAGHTASIRSLNQVAAPVDTSPGAPWDGVIGTAGTTEGAAQTTSTATTPARFSQWYGFGKGERFYYRVNGGATTTSDYTVTMETTPVVATPVGIYTAGQISITTFGQGHTNDTDMWVYDANLNPIRGFGNDDESPNAVGGGPGTGATLQSFLSRPYSPGTYYLALSNFALTNDQPSPSDDDFRTGALLDFPGMILNSSTTANVNLAFAISDGVTTLQVPNTRVGAYDVNWFSFTVVPVPEPTSLGLASIGVVGLLRRRRRN